MTLPITGGPEWSASQATPWLTMNKALRILDAFASRSVIEDRDLSAPPGSCADGARYLIAATGSGAWLSQTGKLAIALGTNASNGWYFATIALEGNQLYVRDEDLLIEYNGSAWVTTPGGVSSLNDLTDVDAPTPNDGDILVYDVTNDTWYPVAQAETPGAPFEMVIAASDETTALTTGTAKITFRMPAGVSLTAVRGALATAQTSGSILTVDINEGGASILSTKLTIDNGEKTSTTAATPPVVSDAALTDDAEMTIDIDQVGDGTAKGLKVTLIGTRI